MTKRLWGSCYGAIELLVENRGRQYLRLLIRDLEGEVWEVRVRVYPEDLERAIAQWHAFTRYYPPGL